MLVYICSAGRQLRGCKRGISSKLSKTILYQFACLKHRKTKVLLNFCIIAWLWNKGLWYCKIVTQRVQVLGGQGKLLSNSHPGRHMMGPVTLRLLLFCSKVRASHLLTASLMTAPSSLAIAKAFWPETETSKLKDRAELGADHEWGRTHVDFSDRSADSAAVQPVDACFSSGTVPMC